MFAPKLKEAATGLSASGGGAALESQHAGSWELGQSHVPGQPYLHSKTLSPPLPPPKKGRTERGKEDGRKRKKKEKDF